MIQLVSKILSKNTADTLAELQGKIDTELSFERQAEKAKSLWNTKTSSKKKRACFEEVKEKLSAMCVSVVVCNYCEKSEANDIEHIHPKSFYPSLAFVWSNYLLACKQCNSACKLDKCYIIENDNAILLERGTEPPSNATIAFINPRVENPNDYMLLNLETFRYMLKPGLTNVEQCKARKTIEILELNTRDTLRDSRRSAAVFYYERMSRLVKIMKTESMGELKSILSPYDKLIDNSSSLADSKVSLSLGFKKDIQTHQHPSVWYAIVQVASKVDAKWKEIFKAFPEALSW